MFGVRNPNGKNTPWAVKTGAIRERGEPLQRGMAAMGELSGIRSPVSFRRLPKYIHHVVHGPSMIVVLLSLLANCERNDPDRSNDPFARAKYRIQQLMEKKNIVSFQVAVARNGEMVLEEAFGTANVEKQIRTTPQTMHLVASIAKPFTSTALMILAERGTIDLKGPINRYLRGSKLIACQGNASDATVARMMLHTSGLPYGYYICGDEIPQRDRRTSREILDLSGVLICPPGTRYQYTNIGYGLLEDLIRDMTGVDMKRFVQDEIIIPLNLENTGFFRFHAPPEKTATQNFDEGALPVAYDADGYTALYSTAGDLVRFGLFHMKAHLPGQKAILADSSLDMLWNYAEPGVEGTTRRLAWDVQQDYGFETVQHGGGGPGIHNWLYTIPSAKVVIAIMSNAWYSNRESDPVLKELIKASLSKQACHRFKPGAGRGYAGQTLLDPADFSGMWNGWIKGPKGSCPVAIHFDGKGRPKMRIEGDPCSMGKWLAPSRKVSKGHRCLLWRFDACIPYLYPQAVHDEVIITLWPEGRRLAGSASAAKEKNFGKGENYVLPQYVELTRTGDR